MTKTRRRRKRAGPGLDVRCTSSGCSWLARNQFRRKPCGTCRALRGAHQGTLQDPDGGRAQERHCRVRQQRTGDAHLDPASSPFRRSRCWATFSDLQQVVAALRLTRRAMKKPKSVYRELEDKLRDEEALIHALRTRQVDAIVGERHHVMLVRLRQTEENLKTSRDQLRVRSRQPAVGARQRTGR